VLCKVTCFLVTQVGKCVQAGGDHFEHLACVVNYTIVTVQLTTIFDKHVLCCFLFYFIKFTVNTHSSVTICKSDPCVYDVSDSELPLVLDPAILTLSPGTSYRTVDS
jgi:hypothetical protein